jgi:hypothetical protein
MENVWDLVKEFKRLVKDNGTIIITTPRLLGVPSVEHLWCFWDEDMLNLFEGFNVKILSEELFPRVIICQAQKLLS